MIPQLVDRIVAGVKSPTGTVLVPGKLKEEAALQVLTADPVDIVLHMEQLWDLATPWRKPLVPVGSAAVPRRPGVRKFLWEQGEFASYLPATATPPVPSWDHLGYSYALENTRIIQILRRVVREYRSGEGLGIASPETHQWLDATEALLFGAANPLASWLSTSQVRPDAEGVRRNAYWRLFGLDLAFGDDQNRPPAYDRAAAANAAFVKLFEELLNELWRAMINERNIAGENAADDDRIYRIAAELGYVLRTRRLQFTLSREEAAAALALGWAELTVSHNTKIVQDLGADATNPAARLQLIGEKVGLAAHSKSAALFPLAAALSTFLRVIEEGIVSSGDNAWVLYRTTKPDQTAVGEPIGEDSRRVITEWAAATGKDLKARARPVAIERPRLVAAR